MSKIASIIKRIIGLLKYKNVIPIQQISDSDHLLSNRTALITGGTGGIGISIAKKFLDSGCKVIISGTNETKLAKAKEMLSSDCVKTLLIDYRHVETFSAKLAEAAHLFNSDIDIFVSATGIHVDRDGLDYINVTEEEYDAIMDVNLKGTYFMCQAVAKTMIKKHVKGHILIISSQSALEPSWSPYRLSKLGISGITKGLAQKLLPYGIVVNGIGPGPTATTMQKTYDGKNIYTPLNPIERYTMPEEVAEFAKMLVSPLGDTIIGDTIYMSGGRGIIEIQ